MDVYALRRRVGRRQRHDPTIALVSPAARSRTERLSVASPSAPREYGRLSAVVVPMIIGWLWRQFARPPFSGAFAELILSVNAPAATIARVASQADTRPNGSPMSASHRWWRGLDHYNWLTAFLSTRGIQRTTCRVMALMIFGLSAISDNADLEPDRPARDTEPDPGDRRDGVLLGPRVAVAAATLADRPRVPHLCRSWIGLHCGLLPDSVRCHGRALRGNGFHTRSQLHRCLPHHPMAGHHLAGDGMTLVILAIRLAAIDIAFAISAVLLVGLHRHLRLVHRSGDDLARRRRHPAREFRAAHRLVQP